jgi:hypothetical protein
MLININADECNPIDNEDIKNKSFKPYESKELVPVGFSCLDLAGEPTDEEIYHMVDHVIYQVLGQQGLASIIKADDKVVMKVNLIGTGIGARGEKNRGGITDPRIVRYLALKIRSIIGTGGAGDLKVVDATFYKDPNPSLKESEVDISFYWARLERTGDNAVEKEDVCYDEDADGILDGGSYARLINLDSLLEDDRDVTKVKVASKEEVTVCLPKLLRTREEAEAEGSNEYCDVLIGLPVLKSHGYTGITGACKLHYGFRHYENMKGDNGRLGHSGVTQDESGIHNKQKLLDYLSAENIVRKYDFVIMDCITGNRSGPMSHHSGLLYTNDKDEPIDYVLINSMLASKDSVAIDTVATVLGGYDPASIDLIKTAHANGLGTNDPRYILLSGFTNFYRHRQFLYEKYFPDKYPFEDGYGDAHVLANKPFLAQIGMKEPEIIGEGTYAFEYRIQGPYNEVLDLSRVELWINNKLIEYKNEGKISEGKFIVNFNKEQLPKDTYLDYIIVVWDKYFNGIQSREIIYKF